MDINVQESYGNCPKYIQKRLIISIPEEFSFNNISRNYKISTSLDENQKKWISSSDTFFLATMKDTKSGGDLSHRGGLPGFVRVLSNNEICWPDYSGKNYYNFILKFKKID